MWKFLKMTVADDVITTEEILVVVLAEEAHLLLEEKEILHQKEKADLEAIEMPLQEKVVLAEEVLLQEKVALEVTEVPLQEALAVLTEPQEDLKGLAMPQESADQEKANSFS